MNKPKVPLAYFVTFLPYGNWLPGDDRGWCDRGDPVRYGPSPGLATYWRRRLRYPVVVLAGQRPDIVRAAIEETCAHRQWPLHALVVERRHVHLVVTAEVSPERVVGELKSWATRRLRTHGHLVDHPHPWAEHGCMRYLYTPELVVEKVRYVLDDHHADAR